MSVEGSGEVVADAGAVFVLGNGPSLANVDLAALPCDSIGMNAAYRHWDRIGWRPTYYVCLDLVVGLSHLEGIRALLRESREDRIRRFLLRSNAIGALGRDAEDERVLNFDAMQASTPLFQLDLLTTGSHAALWAAQMGYRTIVVLGVDGRYREIVEGAVARKRGVLEIKEEQNENPNYFFADYQRPGDLYHVPNALPGLHLNAWRGAAILLASDGALVANGNPNSEVRAFPFVDAQRLVANGHAPLLAPADDAEAFDLEAHRHRIGSIADFGRKVQAELQERPWALPSVAAASIVPSLLGWGLAGEAGLLFVLVLLVTLLLVMQATAALLFLPRLLGKALESSTRLENVLAITQENGRQIQIARARLEAGGRKAKTTGGSEEPSNRAVADAAPVRD